MRKVSNGGKIIAYYREDVREETGSIKKALPPNRLVNVPLSPGGSGIITSTSVVLPLRAGEAYYSTPATPGLRGCRLIRLFGPRRSRTGSLTAQLAVRFPVSASVVPLPYSPCNGSPIYTLGCGFGNASSLNLFQRPSQLFAFLQAN
jgi:hypothetical protein